MTKVVINGCFGGFGLSPEAAASYLARQGKEAFFYAEDRESAPRPGDRDLVKVAGSAAADAFMVYTSTRDFGERVDSITFWGRENIGSPDWYWSDTSLERDDPILVAVVEELGDAASDTYARLRVVEVPDDVAYVIEEYDGIETVVEVHRTWG